MSSETFSAILNRIESLIKDQGLSVKEVLSLTDACLYLGISKSHLYKLTSTGRIPYYKPMGKKLYFKLSELNQWLLRNRSETMEELDQKASNYLIQKGKIRL